MSPPKDGLKWFGEGFDGFPKILPEDCIEYVIFVINSKLNDFEVQQLLRQVQVAATRLTSELLKGFIWQRESFSLNSRRENGRRLLHGRTNYGDSVGDEWLIVYILRELSKQFPQIWVRVFDTDGQFLLIEAANSLPPWLNPEVADHRVWLNSGKLLLIPMEATEGKDFSLINLQKSPDLGQAINFIGSHSSKLVHSVEIEEEAFYRLRRFPQQILDSLHNSMITIPRKLAFILHDNASYVGPAVEAFYLRDPIALRPLQTNRSDGLYFPPSDIVTVSTLFTKVGFAQLKSQHFEPPGPWAKLLSSQLDQASMERVVIGMKLTCGFEMMMSDPQNQDKKVVREITLLLEDLRRGEDQLPLDAEISEWGPKEDSEDWLDINFEDFERELDGRYARAFSTVDEGSKDRHEDSLLRKMVPRFEDFLEDDNAPNEGPGFLDDMDQDDDDDGDDDDDDDDDCKNSSVNADDGDGLVQNGEVRFDESEFFRMMGEIMGLNSLQGTVLNPDDSETVSGSDIRPKQRELSVSSDESAPDIHRAMLEVEGELREAGALRLDLGQTNGVSQPQRKMMIADPSITGDPSLSTATELESHGDEVDIDFNLAKNLLESFKSQAGMPGPGSNLMGVMGLRLPRDGHER